MPPETRPDQRAPPRPVRALRNGLGEADEDGIRLFSPRVRNALAAVALMVVIPLLVVVPVALALYLAAIAMGRGPGE